ncbi:hypothetical protein AGLY_017537 [Aphis glycines]|uniref:Uncharacterized protein n=1 Tax=Aphis glycines TaxID=307491 RepID=A0A6G0SVT0_APHGL|nr:hypothetical protein AGLY_017537 [Aphis glycines]
MVNEEQQRVHRLMRSKLFADAKRKTAISAIRTIHALSLRALKEPEIVSEFLIAATDLEGHWAQFKLEDESFLEHLINLDKAEDYSVDLPAEVRALINASRSVVEKLTPKGVDTIDLSYLKDLRSFILFSIAFRCLPVSTRKLFETSTISDYPTIDELMKFLRNRVAVLEVVGERRDQVAFGAHTKSTSQQGHLQKETNRSGKPRFSSLPTTLVATKPSNSTSNRCPCCSGAHGLGVCARFKRWTVEERSRWTREHKLCFNCFSADHWAPKCTARSRCQDCSRRHHYLLHDVPVGERRNESETPQPVSAPASCCTAVQQPSPPQALSVMLGTALVHVRDRSGSWQTMRALIDCASQISAITATCADRLGLKRSRWTAPISGLSGVAVMNVQGRVECTVHPRFASEPALSIHAWVLPTITSALPTKTLSADIKDKYSNLALADPSFHVSSPIDLLLGSDVYASIMDGRKISVDSALPSAFSSIFGWILIGQVSVPEAGALHSLPVSLTVSIEGLMEKFWHVEEPDVAPATFTENGRCEQVFINETVRLPTGRFSVPLPFRVPVSDELFVASRDIALKKWSSNTKSVLDAVPAADRVQAPTPFETVDGQGTKVLGLEWHPDGDYLCCALSLEKSPVYTKRGILSLVAQIFDPLGVFGPVVFRAKSIMQRTWLMGLSWDEPLPAGIQDEWSAFVSDLPSLLSIRVPRYFNSRRNAPCYLLGFCDASQQGYAAVVYLRVAGEPIGDSVFLVGTKTKLASTKSTTIPRLELNAALLLARWLNRIRNILTSQLNIVDIRAWSDSMIVLSWLKVPHESIKVYVSNRVHQVRTLLPDCQWQYIESVNTPADCASRGVMPSVLSQLDLYWRGPQVVYDDPATWDKSCSLLPLCDLPEIRPVVVCANLTVDEPSEWFIRFSNYDHMLRVVAFMRRFIALCR